ncbi:hypothetical protein F2P79_018753 [Pimephales promelas]|nr:hypothetical protein F2P79_018753 [Pimephales promelas]
MTPGPLSTSSAATPGKMATSGQWQHLGRWQHLLSPLTTTFTMASFSNEDTTAPSAPTAVPTSLASAPPYFLIVLASLPTATTTSPSGTPAMTPAAPQQELAEDERSIPGMDRVDSLAEYLVGLRNETGQTLNSQQASTIIPLPSGQTVVVATASIMGNIHILPQKCWYFTSPVDGGDAEEEADKK